MKNLRQVKNVLSVCVTLVCLLFYNIGFTQEERYTFDAPTVDKIIVNAEQCIITNKNLSQCELMVKSAQEIIELQKTQLTSCENTLLKKDELYGNLSKIKDDQLKICEEKSKQKDEVIKNQQKSLDDVQKIINTAKTKDFWSDIWLRVEWGTVGIIVGGILTAIFL